MKEASHNDKRVNHGTTVHISSERSFGGVFTFVFVLIGLAPLLDWHAPRWWALSIGALFLLVTLTKPQLLRPLNQLWFRFGLLLHRFITPASLGAVFLFVVIPIGFSLRLFGKDPLRLRFDRAASTYWIHREPPGPAPDSMRQQF